MSEPEEKSGITDAFTKAVTTGNFNDLNEQLNTLADSAIGAAGAFLSNSSQALQNYTDNKEEMQRKKAEAKRKRELAPMTASPAGTVSGPVLLICGIVLLLVCAAIAMTAYTLGTMGIGLAFLIIPVIASIWMISKGFSLNHRVALFREMKAGFNGEPFVSMQKLQDITGMTDRKTYNTVKEFIAIKYFPKGQLVYRDRYLILSPGAKEYLDKYLKEKEKEEKLQAQQARLTKEFPTLKAASEAIQQTIATIHMTENSRTARNNEEFGTELKSLEATMTHINEYILQNPDHIPNLKNFLGYFLPTVDKLLSTYNTLDAQKLQTSTIKESKKEIEETLESINHAFKRMYDGFFKETAIDVSSDISVMNSLFAKNGLQDPDFTAK
ncbi:MAG: SdpI family protein [Eubacteriaceae bacterium]